MSPHDGDRNSLRSVVLRGLMDLRKYILTGMNITSALAVMCELRVQKSETLGCCDT